MRKPPTNTQASVQYFKRLNMRISYTLKGKLWEASRKHGITCSELVRRLILDEVRKLGLVSEDYVDDGDTVHD